MLSLVRHWVMMPVMAAGAAAVAVVTGTQPSPRDGIGELLKRTDAGAQVVQAQATQPAPPSQSPAASIQAPPATAKPPTAADAREGEANNEQAQRLMKAVDALLQDAARNRGEARKLPSESDYIVRPIWTETREDRERRIRELLDSALGRRHRCARRRPAEENRGPAQEHPRARRPHRQAAREAARRPQGRHAAGHRDRHRGQPRQGHRRDQEAYRAQPRRDRQHQGRGDGGAQEGGRPAFARTGRPAARQRALGRPGAPGRRVQFGQDDRRPARQADDRIGREHRRGAQIFCHACGPVRFAGALAGPADRQDRQAVPAQAVRDRGRHPHRARQDRGAAASSRTARTRSARWRATARASASPRKPPRATAAICCSSASRSPRRASAQRTTCGSPTTLSRPWRRATSCAT